MFAKISQGQSTIFITHRLGAAKLADEIIVISNGSVAEQGPHDMLMKNNGLYAKMFESQRSWYLFSLKPTLILSIVLVFIPTAATQLVRTKIFSKLEDKSAFRCINEKRNKCGSLRSGI